MNNINLPKFKLIGLKLAGKTRNENGQSATDCGGLWQEFTIGNCIDKIPNKLSDEIFAVYYDYEGDHTKPYSYFIGCKVEANTQTPEGMHSILIPVDSYTKRIAKGTMPDCIGEAWREIWTSNMQRAYHFDFEIYGENSKDWNDAIVDIYLSV